MKQNGGFSFDAKAMLKQRDALREEYREIMEKVSHVTCADGFDDAREAINESIELINDSNLLERTGFIIKRLPDHETIEQRYALLMSKLDGLTTRILAARMLLARNVALLERYGKRLDALCVKTNNLRDDIVLYTDNCDTRTALDSDNRENIGSSFDDLTTLIILSQQGAAQCKLLATSVQNMVTKLDDVEKINLPTWSQQIATAVGVSLSDASLRNNDNDTRTIEQLVKRNATEIRNNSLTRARECETRVNENALRTADDKIIKALRGTRSELETLASNSIK